MKKKIIGYIMLIVLVIPIAIVLAACGGKKEEKKMTITLNQEYAYWYGTNTTTLETAQGSFHSERIRMPNIYDFSEMKVLADGEEVEGLFTLNSDINAYSDVVTVGTVDLSKLSKDTTLTITGLKDRTIKIGFMNYTDTEEYKEARADFVNNYNNDWYMKSKYGEDYTSGFDNYYNNKLRFLSNYYIKVGEADLPEFEEGGKLAAYKNNLADGYISLSAVSRIEVSNANAYYFTYKLSETMTQKITTNSSSDGEVYTNIMTKLGRIPVRASWPLGSDNMNLHFNVLHYNVVSTDDYGDDVYGWSMSYASHYDSLLTDIFYDSSIGYSEDAAYSTFLNVNNIENRSVTYAVDPMNMGYASISLSGEGQIMNFGDIEAKYYYIYEDSSAESGYVENLISNYRMLNNKIYNGVYNNNSTEMTYEPLYKEISNGLLYTGVPHIYVIKNTDLSVSYDYIDNSGFLRSYRWMEAWLYNSQDNSLGSHTFSANSNNDYTQIFTNNSSDSVFIKLSDIDEEGGTDASKILESYTPTTEEINNLSINKGPNTETILYAKFKDSSISDRIIFYNKSYGEDGYIYYDMGAQYDMYWWYNSEADTNKLTSAYGTNDYSSMGYVKVKNTDIEDIATDRYTPLTTDDITIKYDITEGYSSSCNIRTGDRSSLIGYSMSVTKYLLLDASHNVDYNNVKFYIGPTKEKQVELKGDYGSCTYFTDVDYYGTQFKVYKCVINLINPKILTASTEEELNAIENLFMYPINYYTDEELNDGQGLININSLNIYMSGLDMSNVTGLVGIKLTNNIDEMNWYSSDVLTEVDGYSYVKVMRDTDYYSMGFQGKGLPNFYTNINVSKSELDNKNITLTIKHDGTLVKTININQYIVDSNMSFSNMTSSNAYSFVVDDIYRITIGVTENMIDDQPVPYLSTFYLTIFAESSNTAIEQLLSGKLDISLNVA